MGAALVPSSNPTVAKAAPTIIPAHTPLTQARMETGGGRGCRGYARPWASLTYRAKEKHHAGHHELIRAKPEVSIPAESFRKQNITELPGDCQSDMPLFGPETGHFRFLIL